MMRFSPVSGTTSATVAMATSLEQRFGNAPHLLRRPAERGQQRLRQLERHARAAQILFEVQAIGPIGIEHGQRRRQFGSRAGDDR